MMFILGQRRLCEDDGLKLAHSIHATQLLTSTSVPNSPCNFKNTGTESVFQCHNLRQEDRPILQHLDLHQLDPESS